MCESCWAGYGSPKINTPAVIDMAARMKKEGGYGRFHIVIEDFNIDDDDIRFCRDEADDKPITDEEVRLANDMLAMTVEERASALALCDGYWSINEPTQNTHA